MPSVSDHPGEAWDRSASPGDVRLHADIAAARARVAVWGCGPIGLSTAVALADRGFRCSGVDVDPALVRSLSAGTVPFAGFDDWVKVDLRPLLEDGRLTFSTDPDAAAGASVQVVAVGTDAGAEIDRSAVDEVARRLGEASTGLPRLVTIESTVAPNWLAEFAAAARGGAPPGPPCRFGVAPRRDWLLDDGRTLRTLPRVVGGEDPVAARLLEALYAHVCDEVLTARDWQHASLVKSVENATRFLDLVLVNQLALAYPGMDVAEVLRLAGTKWNVPTYHPSVGIGGYCVPLGPRYLLEPLEGSPGGDVPLLREALDWDRTYPRQVVERVMSAGGAPGRVLLLGLSYAPDVKIARLSPAAALARAFADAGVEAVCHDPYFSEAEIRAEAGCPAAPYPEGLAGAGMVVVVAAHECYRGLREALEALDEPPPVLDNLGSLRASFEGSGLDYREMGGPRALRFGGARGGATGRVPGGGGRSG